jgi:hypothetical protein
MKRLIFVFSLLVTGTIAAAAPARADFAVVQFGSGFCRVWWDSTGVPWGIGWTKLSIGLPDYTAALAVLDNAVAQGTCR